MKSTFCILIFCLAVSLIANSQTIIFSDDFSSGSFGLKWIATPGTPNGVVSINASIGSSGNGVRMGKSIAGGGLATNTLDLVLDLSPYNNLDVAMTFDIQDRADESDQEEGIYFSDNGGASFTKVFSFNPSVWCDYDYGSFPPFDIDSLAAVNGLSLTSNFVIRFQQQCENKLPDNDGLYLDNVSVFVEAITYFNSFPFEDNFNGSFTLGNMWTKSFPWQTNILVPDPNRPNNVIEIGGTIGVGGSRAIRMGKNCADGYSTNALDLHLDLSGNSDYALTFDINSRGDDTDANDGLYFSNNGGESFEKVFDFNPSVWCDYDYGSFPPFDIDSLAGTKSLSLTNRFVIRFQQHGNNVLPDNDGFYIDNVSVFIPTISYVNMFPFTDDFNNPNNTFGNMWTKSFPWQTTAPGTDPNRPNNVIDIVNGVGTGGSRGVIMGKDCDDGDFSTNALDLHLDLSGGSDYALTFDINNRGDDTEPEDGLYFSNNGGESFEKVFDFNPSVWCDDNYGSFPPFDIDSLAAGKGLSLTNRFVIRFQQHGENILPINDGFYIDNVSVIIPTITYVNQFPFTDDFNNPNDTFGNMWTKSFPWQTTALGTDPNRPNNVIDIVNGVGTGGSRGVSMGKDCDDGDFSTNALDLHLDLSGGSNYALTFDINNRGDDTEPEDGLYFSNNGGESFEKVFDFNPSVWCDDNYGSFPPFDIDSLAAGKGLSLTNRFVIRFQQHGENVLPINDGFYIDNVSVFVPTLVYYNQFPFTENFEDATLGNMWKRSFPYKTSTLVTDPNRPNNIIELRDFIGINLSRAVRIGKECADGYSTNALDLHLNLSGLGEATLNCKIRDRGDDTDLDDGVFFSDNGGDSFEKVFDFDFSNVPNDYTDYVFDLDSLATSKGLSFTSHFIVRFQQHGNNVLPDNDGFYIDNVNISGVVSTVEANSLGNFIIYPNPTREFLILDISDFFYQDGFNYTIRNSTGITQLSGRIISPKDKIDINFITDGLYIIEILGSNGRASRKFLKF